MRDIILQENYAVEEGKIRNPFPGLRPFRDDEIYLFFGREEQIDEIIEKLEKNRFIAILGTSGSGKSSLMYCGLLPSLYAGFLSSRGSQWTVVVSRPGTSPIDNLAKNIVDAIKKEEIVEELNENLVLAILRNSSLGLVELLKKIYSYRKQNFLIVIDQFEELFRFSSNRGDFLLDEYKLFVKLICEASQQTDIPIYVTTTMRSDYIGECSIFTELTKLINESHFLIPQMNRKQKMAAVLGPIRIMGNKISPNLVQRVLNDSTNISDQLPVMQHAMMRTWNLWREESKADLNYPINISHYEKVGGVRKALSMHANEAFYELNKKEQFICSKIFKTITEKTIDGKGIRRPCKLQTLMDVIDVDKEEIIKVINVFRSQDRNFILPNIHNVLVEDSMIDISHESLMRVWDKCKNWVEEESDAAKIYLKMAEQVESYEKGTSPLAVPPDLTFFEKWRIENKPNLFWGMRYYPYFEKVIYFLDKSKQAYEEQLLSKERARKKKAQRARASLIFLVAVVVFLIFIGLFAWQERNIANEQKEIAEVQKKESDKQKKIAEEQQKIALQREKEAITAKILADSSRVKAIFALEQVKVQKNRAERAANEAMRQQKIADLQKKKAKEQESIAIKNATIARKNQIKAQTSEKEAILSAQEAERLRYLSIAKSMAVKSLRIKNVEQKALIATQAYIFHKKYDGYPAQMDIYEGLYYAIKSLKGNEFNHILGHKGNIIGLAFLEKDNQFISFGSGSKIMKFDSPFSPGILLEEENKVFRKITKSSNGKWIASIFRFNTPPVIYLLGKDGTIASKIELYLDRSEVFFTDIQFSLNNRGIYASDDTGKLFYWEIPDKTDNITRINNPKEVMGGDNRIEKFVFLSENEILVSYADNKLYRQERKYQNRWEKVEEIITGFNSPCTALAVNPENKEQYIIGLLNGEVIIKDGGKTVVQLDAHTSKVSKITYSKGSKLFLTASYDGTVKIWNVKNTNQQPIELSDQNDWITTAEFSKDGQYVLLGSFGTIRYYPINYDWMLDQVCNSLERKKMTKKEWDLFVGDGKYIQHKSNCK